MSQPSISRFFQKSKQSCSLKTTNSQELIEIDCEEDVEVQDALDPKSAELEAMETPSVQASNFRYVTSVAQSSGEAPGEKVDAHERLKMKLNQISSTTTKKDQDEEGTEASSEPEPLKTNKKQKKSKLTPLEQQVKDLKLNHLDKVLAIQVGYKYKFYCDDAVKVSSILNIMLLPGKINLVSETAQDLQYDKLAYCSIPENRLHIHLQRLLDNGLKVGVVNQIETSTMKNVDSGSSGLFKRDITSVFTKATYVEYDDKHGVGIKSDKSSDSIVVLIEDDCLVTLVAFQPLSGKIIYDEFKDVEFMKTELKTRLAHLEPLEFLYFQNNLSKDTEKVLSLLNLDKSIRIVTYPQSKKTHYLTHLSELIDESIVEFMFNKSRNFRICCALLIEYLQEFHLDSAFKRLSNFTPFDQTQSMLINSNTLENLEVIQNSTNQQEKGSLLWVLDHTRTKFGYRLLKRWVLAPSINLEVIQGRLDAVAELQSFNHFFDAFANTILKNCQDLEKNLNRLNYRSIKRKELYTFLNKLSDLQQLIIKFGNYDLIPRLGSQYMKDLFKSLIKKTTELNPNGLTNLINGPHALDDSNDDHIINYFNIGHLHEFINVDDLQEAKLNINSIREELDTERLEIRKVLRRPHVEFVEKSKEPYLIEIQVKHVKTIPHDWIKINATKSVARFRTPRVAKLLQSLRYHQELHLKVSHEIFVRFITMLSEHYESMKSIIYELSKFDCLLALTTISSQDNYTRPNFTSKGKVINLKGSRNPILEALNPTDIIVPNNIHINDDSSHIIITGPNMGGKSSIVKQTALIQIMAQIGCFIPAGADSELCIFNKILTRMGAKDDLIKGESTFYVEMSQVSKILKELELCPGNALVILDEVGRGTGTIDGISIAESILEYLLVDEDARAKACVLFITHFPSICKMADKYTTVENYHMGFIEETTKSVTENVDWPKITFLYELKKGMSSSSYGLNVASLAGIDRQILNVANLKSKERQRQVELNKAFGVLKQALRLLVRKESPSKSRLEELLSQID